MLAIGMLLSTVLVPAAGRADESEIKDVYFYSAELRKTVHVSVILPPGYDAAKGPYNTLYFLHGSANESQNDFGPRVLEGIPDDLAAYDIVGIVPDSGSGWTDAKEPKAREVRWEADWPQENEPILGINRGSATVTEPGSTVGQQSYEHHLLQELMPLMEASFNLRQDRGGRGVMGHSGGNYGSFIFGMRHPDVFAFVGGSSGPISWRDESWYAVGAALDVSWGGRDPMSDEIFMRARDPKELAENLLGSGVTLMHSSGCVDPVPADFDPTCGLEGLARPIHEDFYAHVSTLGLDDYAYFRLDGPDQRTHAAAAVAIPIYEQEYIPAAAAIFADPPDHPDAWRYKTIDARFELWGWRFAVERPNTEFLTLLDVNPSRLVARGTGWLEVETPQAYDPGVLYKIRTTGPDEATTVLGARADEAGRLRFTVELGSPRLVDQQSALESAGLFSFEDYVVTIEPDDEVANSEARVCAPVWIYPVAPCR